MRKLLHEKVQKYIMGQIMYKKSVSKYVSLYDLQNILFREEKRHIMRGATVIH